MLRVRLFICLPVFLGLAIGCGSRSQTPARVSGSVKYKGQPVKAGTVKFHSQNAGMYSAGIKEDGTYALTDLPTGDMKVSIETESVNPDKATQQYGGGKGPGGRPMGGMAPPKGSGPEAMSKQREAFGGQAPPPSKEQMKDLYVKIPAKYADPEKSGLTATLVAGDQVKDFDLAD